jgi:hypothetical protein
MTRLTRCLAASSFAPKVRHTGIKARSDGNEKRGFFSTQRRQGAKALSPDTNSTNRREFKCAKGATEISPGLEQHDYPG